MLIEVKLNSDFVAISKIIGGGINGRSLIVPGGDDLRTANRQPAPIVYANIECIGTRILRHDISRPPHLEIIRTHFGNIRRAAAERVPGSEIGTLTRPVHNQVTDVESIRRRTALVSNIIAVISAIQA
jgi:hypothetical protein